MPLTPKPVTIPPDARYMASERCHVKQNAAGFRVYIERAGKLHNVRVGTNRAKSKTEAARRAKEQLRNRK